MKQLRLDVEALEVATAEMGGDNAVLNGSYTTDTCTFQNTCDSNCHWTI